MDLKIGADPEMFVSRQDNTPTSAYGLIPGTKRKPHPVPKGAVQVDGTALEINIDPASSEEEFVGNIDAVLSSLRAMVPDEYKINIIPAVHYPTGYMATLPDEARELGCDPDYNAYTMNENPPINEGMAGDMRVAGGHVHVGWGEDYDVGDQHHFNSCARLAKQLDYYLGIPSLLLDSDNERRKMYGFPGSFRPKPYGMEYRVLSNFWLKSPGLQKFIFNQTKRAFHALAVEHSELDDQFHGIAQEIITYNNTGKVKKYMEGLSLVEDYSDYTNLVKETGAV